VCGGVSQGLQAGGEWWDGAAHDSLIRQLFNSILPETTILDHFLPR
jgi:hypothetical protein